MTDANEALFVVRLPVGTKTVDFDDATRWIAQAKNPPLESLDEHGLDLFGADWVREESELKTSIERGDVEVLDSSYHAFRPPFTLRRLEMAVLTVKAFREYVESIYGFVEVEDTPEPQQTAPATDAAKPAPEVTDQTEAVEPASDGPAKPAAPAWSLKRPERFQGYGKPLYDLLKAVHAAGQPKPSARDVLDRWKEKPPPDVAEVTDNGLKYYDAQGNTKPADLEAIRKAIGRMTKRAPDCRTLEPVSARLSRLHREINP